MGKVAIVTDSTAYLPKSIIDQYNIHIVPLNVIFGEESLQDGVDIKANEFYDRLKTSSVHPSTSQPSPEQFMKVYQSLLDQDYQIVSMHISSKLSGTVASAIQAKQIIGNGNIEVIDSLSTSMGMGYQIIHMAKMIENGADLKQVTDFAKQEDLQHGAYFTVASLEYLRRGGRIGGASAFLGTALGIKPILELTGGKIEAHEKVRTFNKAVKRMCDCFEQKLEKGKKIYFAVIHAQAENEAKKVSDALNQSLGDYDIEMSLITEISPVIGTHTGPGTVGVIYLQVSQ